jgi:quinoprotein glucose dehydrogenase
MMGHLRRTILALGCVLLIVVGTTPNLGKDGLVKGEWRNYGGDSRSLKYSPLDQINKDNAGKLQVAWTWESPDIPLQKQNRMLGSFGYSASPIMIGGVLYISTNRGGDKRTNRRDALGL